MRVGVGVGERERRCVHVCVGRGEAVCVRGWREGTEVRDTRHAHTECAHAPGPVLQPAQHQQEDDDGRREKNEQDSLTSTEARGAFSEAPRDVAEAEAAEEAAAERGEVEHLCP